MALPEVDFLTWAIGVGANVESQADYSVDPAQQVGVSPGLARSALFNKSQRQSAFVTSTLAMLMAAVTNNAILDDGNQNEFWKNLWEALLGVQYFVDTGTTNHIVVAAPQSLTFDAAFAGVQVSVKMLHTNTGPVDFAYMGHSPAPVIYSNGSPLGASALLVNSVVQLCFDGASWQVVSLPSNGVRTRLQAATDYYFDHGAGSDVNPGTAALPWQTLQGSWNNLYGGVDGGGQTVNLHQVDNGADTGGLAATGEIPGIQTLNLILTAGINTGAAAGVIASEGARINVTLGGSNTGSITALTWDLIAQNDGFIRFSGITLGACAQAKVSADQGGQIIVAGNYIDGAGASASHFEALGGEIVVFPNATCTQNGAAYTQFALCNLNGAARLDTLTLAGTPSTGLKFTLSEAGGIYRNDATLTGTYAANGGNTGNFTCGTVTVTSAMIGTYNIQFLAATIFNVYYPNGGFVGKGVTGSAFTGGGLSFTLTAGGTPAVLGDGATIAIGTTSLPGTNYSIDYKTSGWYK